MFFQVHAFLNMVVNGEYILKFDPLKTYLKLFFLKLLSQLVPNFAAVFFRWSPEKKFVKFTLIPRCPPAGIIDLHWTYENIFKDSLSNN